MWHGINILRSEGHEISLSPFDSKRWIADDGVNTKAYGYTRPLFTNTGMEEIEALFATTEMKEIEALLTITEIKEIEEALTEMQK